MAYRDKKKLKEYQKKYQKKYYQQNKKKIDEYQKEYYKKNKETILECQKQYYEENKENKKENHKKYYEENKAKVKQKNKKYSEENKEKISEYQKEYYQKNKEQKIKQATQRKKIRYQEDINYRIVHNLRARLQQALKGTNKSARTIELLGCSAEQLREHLEAQFADGMTWNNYGLKGWHIDHIRPCASFDLTDPQQQLECFHYTNLRPLWAEDNIKKGAKYNND